MYVQQFFVKGLAHLSYILAGEKVAQSLIPSGMWIYWLKQATKK